MSSTAFARGGALGLARAPMLIALAALAMAAAAAAVYYVNSAHYLDGRKLDRASALEAEGRTGEALDLFAEVAEGDTGHAREAVQHLERAARAALGAGTGEQVLAAVDFAHRRRGPGGLPFADFVAVALARVERLAATDLATALAVADRLRGIAPERDETIDAARRRLLEVAVTTHPDEPGYAVDLALLVEGEGDLERAVALLTPHRGAVGTGEGARILGQRDVARGDYDAAYALLQPYVERRLEEMRAVEARFDQRYDALYDVEIAKLNDGEGPQSFYDAWDAAGEAERPSLVDEYVTARLDGNSELESLRTRWMEVSAVVPIALDVGTLMLFRAQDMADAAARQAQLEKAEATFLAVQGVAGESERYRRTLGQVYFWLGRHDEGQAQFDALLADGGRAPETLLEVSEIYRELGIDEPALRLAEEAHETATGDEQRYRAAHQCAILLAGTDDEVMWLERSDPQDPSVQATLAEARARIAIAEDDLDEAAAQLRKAVEIYGRQERTSTSSNNHALAAFSLHGIAPDPAVLAEAREHMILAATLAPSNAIVLGNAVAHLLATGLAEFQEREMGLSELEWEADYHYFSALWDSPDEHAAVVARFLEVPGVREAHGWLGKALVLRPKDDQLYDLAWPFYDFVRDEEALVRFAQQLEAAAQDRSGYAREAAEYYLGTADEELLSGVQEHYEYWVGAFSDRSEGRTAIQRTLILSEYLGAARRAARHGIAVNAKPLVAAALAVDGEAPSRMSRNLVVTSLLLGVFRDLQDADALADALRGCPRCLMPDALVALAASESSPLGERVRAHADTRRAAARLAKDLDRHAGFDTVTAWALLARLEPQAAERLAAVLRDNATARAINDATLLRHSNYPMGIYARALLARLRADPEAEATAMSRFDSWGLAPPVAPAP